MSEARRIIKRCESCFKVFRTEVFLEKEEKARRRIHECSCGASYTLDFDSLVRAYHV